jgi:hypothetical protein
MIKNDLNNYKIVLLIFEFLTIIPIISNKINKYLKNVDLSFIILFSFLLVMILGSYIDKHYTKK